MKKITIEDLNYIVSASDVQYSPDGQHLAFVTACPDQRDNNYKRNLWIGDDKEVKQLTFSGKDGAFCWQDEKTLLFPTERAKEDEAKELEEKTCFYRLDITGGEAKKAFELPKTVVFFHQAEPGVYLFGIKEDRNALPVLADNEAERREEKDYHVIDEIPLWANGSGFVSGQRTVLYLYKEADGSLKRLSPEYMDAADVDIFGKKVLCRGKEWKDLIGDTDSVILYDLETGEEKKIVEQGTYIISGAFFWNGEIWVTATDMKPYGTGQYHDYYRYCEADGTLEKMCAVNRQLGLDIMTDCNYGGGKYQVIDGGRLYVIGQCGHNDSIFELVKTDDGKAELREVFAWRGLISGIDCKDGRMVFTGMAANGCAELYEICDSQAVKRTALNDSFLAEHFVAEAKYIPFVNAAGITVEGWVLEPEGFDPEDKEMKYPGILEIHGGPRCTYGEVFFHEMQTWVSNGWFVFFCNPRGSEGYGEEYADLRGKYGTIDYEDLMAFTDHVLALYPQIDTKRLGAAGGSYGGFMCNWIVGHTDRFAAIASQRSISNWVSDFGCSEIGVTFNPNEMCATPWDHMEKMWEASPLKYAHNAKTPILFIHSMCDYNCTIDQGVQMFTAMKYFGVPSKMCLFEGENHSLSRTGKPRHRMRRLKEMTDWFEKYLK